MVEAKIEPWLRGTLTDVSAVPRAVLHALEQAAEDAAKWCAELTDAEIEECPLGLPSVAFHLRHIARSLDRLLTYAEGEQLSGDQMAMLKCEGDAGATRASVLAEFGAAIELSARRVRSFAESDLSQPRGVGRKQLPTTIGGLLVHIADHTQRHVGQAITTAKVLLAQR